MKPYCRFCSSDAHWTTACPRLTQVSHGNPRVETKPVTPPPPKPRWRPGDPISAQIVAPEHVPRQRHIFAPGSALARARAAKEAKKSITQNPPPAPVANPVANPEPLVANPPEFATTDPPKKKGGRPHSTTPSASTLRSRKARQAKGKGDPPPA